jgi:hypothetical protein
MSHLLSFIHLILDIRNILSCVAVILSQPGRRPGCLHVNDAAVWIELVLFGLLWYSSFVQMS